MKSLDRPNLVPLIVAILVKRLGKQVTITHEDIDDVAFGMLAEKVSPDGSIEFSVLEPAQT